MTAFISHSFDNRAEFDNVADAFDQGGVPYWNPAEIKSGSSLRDQLRRAVERCSVCIFLATHKALRSSWCGAELGAFWGAGKPIVVYIADSSLEDDDLPPIVQGDVWERRMSRLVARTRELIAEAGAASGGPQKTPPASVGSMTAEQLEKLIVGAVSLAAANAAREGRASTTEELGQAAKGLAGRVLEGMRATERAAQRPADRRRQILWVDDRPDNNAYERSALEALGFEFTLALSTREALDVLSSQQFAAIISDMGRQEGPQEGYVLLNAVRASGDRTPFFIYAGSNAPAHKREAAARGAQGSTNSARELYDMVIQSLGG
ncbi:MAG TPA: hypothetical protein DEH78_02310 [Solibacterales bacterium]|nr:hypothetical protein [Bryobacterales bacterium]